MQRSIAVAAAALVAVGCATTPEAPSADLDPLAERFVRLTLGIGVHDPVHVDAYYGPEAWRDEVEAAAPDIATLQAEADALRAALAAAAPSEEEAGRRDYLMALTVAADTRLAMLAGEALSFDEEAVGLYGATVAPFDAAHAAAVFAQLDAALPGEGSLSQRRERLQDRLAIPADRVGEVVALAIDACRAATAEHIALPEGERFDLELVEGHPWSAYNWYEGDRRSRIQINVDRPVTVDTAIILGCHEGYPGHHLQGLLAETVLVEQRNWSEYTVLPLFSPAGFLAEGLADLGVELAFPEPERRALLTETLMPAAGVDPALVDSVFLTAAAGEEAALSALSMAREYRDGRWTAEEYVANQVRYLGAPEQRARSRVAFIDAYGAYVVNYTLGRRLAREYVRARAGEDRDQAWDVFLTLTLEPVTPAALSES